jgi:hypothetical protein
VSIPLWNIDSYSAGGSQQSRNNSEDQFSTAPFDGYSNKTLSGAYSPLLVFLLSGT